MFDYKPISREVRKMVDVLVCLKCGRIHSDTYDGLKCRDPKCDGKLILTQMFEKEKKDEGRIKSDCQWKIKDE